MRTILKKYHQLPLISGTLVFMNVLVFGICMMTGDALYAVARLSVVETIYGREYGRILWAMFVHGDLSHIFNNMLILFFLGAMLEKEVGHMWLMLTYFLSGVGGNVLSLLVKVSTNDWSASIGASGAVFGLDGMLLALVLFAGRKLPAVTPARAFLMIALSLYSGFTGSNIDNSAHVGGLVTGFVLGTVICLIQRRKWMQGEKV